MKAPGSRPDLDALIRVEVSLRLWAQVWLDAHNAQEDPADRPWFAGGRQAILAAAGSIAEVADSFRRFPFGPALPADLLIHFAAPKNALASVAPVTELERELVRARGELERARDRVLELEDQLRDVERAAR